MAESDFVFEQGEPVIVGSHGEHEYAFAQSEPILNAGESEFVFQSGIGIGGISQLDVWFFVDTTGSSDVYQTQIDACIFLIDEIIEEFGEDGIIWNAGKIGGGSSSNYHITGVKSGIEDGKECKDHLDNSIRGDTSGSQEEYWSSVLYALENKTAEDEYRTVTYTFGDYESGDSQQHRGWDAADAGNVIESNDTGDEPAVAVMSDEYVPESGGSDLEECFYLVNDPGHSQSVHSSGSLSSAEGGYEFSNYVSTTDHDGSTVTNSVRSASALKDDLLDASFNAILEDTFGLTYTEEGVFES